MFKRMNKVVFLALMFLLSACGQSHKHSPAEDAITAYYSGLCTEFTYTTDGTGTMLIGDSNTYALPNDVLPGNYVNCGTVGFTASLANWKLQNKFPRYNPGTVIIWIGTNDAKDNISNEDFSLSISALFDYLKGKGVNVYVRNILPTGGKYAGFNPRTIELNTITEDLLSSYTYTLLKSRRFFEDAGGYLSAQYSEDGLHLNAEGHDILKQHFFEP